MASKYVIDRMRTFSGPSVWLEFTPLAALTGSVNMGQGKPGWNPPDFVKDALGRSARDDSCMQYSHPSGEPRLRGSIAEIYAPVLASQHISGVSADEDVLVTVGASQALSLACTALLQEGDEVILFEPAFDVYTGAARMAGATPVYVPMRIRDKKDTTNTTSLTSDDLYIDMEELSAAITDRTRMLILNSPHNPTGKVFSHAELVSIAELLDAKAPDCIVLSDEVYEHLVFDGKKHIPFATVSETAKRRTISVYSAGKTFAVTGWKIGWIICFNGDIMRQLKLAQQFICFSISSVTQVAIAEALVIARDMPYEGCGNYYQWVRNDYLEKRDFMLKAFSELGLQAIAPEGAFYIMAKIPQSILPVPSHDKFPHDMQTKFVDTKLITIDEATRELKDYNICRNLTITKGVAAIPPSAFFSKQHRKDNPLAEQYARFAFCKPVDELTEAINRLRS